METKTNPFYCNTRASSVDDFWDKQSIHMRLLDHSYIYYIWINIYICVWQVKVWEFLFLSTFLICYLTIMTTYLIFLMKKFHFFLLSFDFNWNKIMTYFKIMTKNVIMTKLVMSYTVGLFFQYEITIKFRHVFNTTNVTYCFNLKYIVYYYDNMSNKSLKLFYFIGEIL